MLREVKALHGATIHARDGEVGTVDEILFDDEHWTVRYLIVDTGGWLFNRKVLISPIAFGHLDWEQHTLHVDLTRAQIESSPCVEADEPVSRRWEAHYYDYYGWPYYWGGMGEWGSFMYPGMLYAQPVDEAQTARQSAAEEARDRTDAHLRSTKEVSGYGISATDGHIGHVEDFLVKDESWRICYLAVDTVDWWPGKHVLLPPESVGQVSWPDRSVMVNLTREQVRNGPEWSPGEPISRDFEDQLYAYYARNRDGHHELLIPVMSHVEI